MSSRARQPNQALDALHDDLLRWGRQHDPLVARRRTEAVPRQAPLLIVAEAYARTTVRVTGVNWFGPDGQLGNAGAALEELLNAAGATLAPPRRIALDALTTSRNDGARVAIARARAGLASAYTTDIFPSYPTIRRHPTSAQVADAMTHGFLAREIAMVRPRVILLLGAIAYDMAHRHLLRTVPPGPLARAFAALSPATVVDAPRYADAVVLPWLHPSGASAAYAAWRRSAGPDVGATAQVAALRAALTPAPGPRTRLGET